MSGESEKPQNDSGIVTTTEEIEAYAIVKAILRGHVDLDRVIMRDQKSFCNVLLDNTLRKNICRFRFDSSDKTVGIFNSSGSEVEHKISDINVIFNLAEPLKERIRALTGKAD